MKKAILIGLCAAMLLCAACGSANTLDSAPGACLQNSSLGATARTAPKYPSGEEMQEGEDYGEMLTGLTAFSSKTASALLGRVRYNAVYSPVSLYLALTLSASGASGRTLSEMYDVLGLAGKSRDEVANLAKALFNDLFREEEFGHLRLYNSLWLSSENAFKQDFLKGAEENYFAEIYTVDPEAALTSDPISDWVAKKTGGRLSRDSGPRGEIVMNLVSVIDFYGEWTSRFDKNRNATGPFTLSDGTEVNAEYMFGGSTGGFYRCDGWTMASRFTKNGAEMAFILPDKGKDINDLLADEHIVAAMLSPENAEGVQHLYGEIVWSVPKFDFRSQFALSDMLRSLGIKSAFSEKDADFSQTSDLKPLFLSDARQASRISVDENGVAASAYTELFYTGSGQPQDRAEMLLNRPFAFVIRYRDVPLFVGVVNNPSL